jgi:hypothetical protein
LHTNVSSPMAAGFSQSGSIATPNWCNEAESSSLSLRLASSSNRASRWGLLLSVPTRLHVGHSVNTLTTFQANREVRLSLTHRMDTDSSGQEQWTTDDGRIANGQCGAFLVFCA